ncbi:hypothetical protein FXN65_19090 [Metapseudomonas lalkuanensis]|uniref:Uncharacterized protein n=1 Tax=Metapseudomonas lalkuanensis TaxID=2604832 RepID=A0A5J6QR52_9GAMM|nr:hypothetical protein [Pseudomonas lalkuanensis]QEY64055.1 hypothetical protein FXN65_19090 [Pseudomonas lalkuanensis]UCO96670.1 hypothetical protein LF844_18605 [Pseudomonas lalkuanensis]
MSSSDTFGVRSELRHGRQGRQRPRHRLIAVHQSLSTRMSGIATATLPAAGRSGSSGQPLSDTRAEELVFLASVNEVQQYPLDAAEQRNAEDSPSGIARHCSLGLTG